MGINYIVKVAWLSVEDEMDWTLFLTAMSVLGAAAAAGAASWQAYETRKQVAESKSQREMAKEQFLQARYDDARPVLILVSDAEKIPVQAGNGLYLDWERQPPPMLDVCNVGKGPALNVKSVIYGPEAAAFATQSPMSGGFEWKYLSDEKAKEEKEKHWYHWITDAVGQGECKELRFNRASKLFGTNHFSETHMCLESNEHTHSYTFNAPKQPLENPSTSKDLWRICRVTITYQDIFRRKHASIYDLVFQQGWQAVALLDDISEDLGDLVG